MSSVLDGARAAVAGVKKPGLTRSALASHAQTGPKGFTAGLQPGHPPLLLPRQGSPCFRHSSTILSPECAQGRLTP